MGFTNGADEQMTRYFYKTNAESEQTRTLKAENDEAALKRLKDKFGEHLTGVMIVYTYASDAKAFRTVWLE